MYLRTEEKVNQPTKQVFNVTDHGLFTPPLSFSKFISLPHRCYLVSKSYKNERHEGGNRQLLAESRMWRVQLSSPFPVPPRLFTFPSNNTPQI